MTEKVHLKIASAVVIGGDIQAKGAIVEVDEPLAKDLLRRGKAELATEHDRPAPVEAEAAEVEQEADPEPVAQKPAKAAKAAKS